jgi:hypothetical protein
MIPEKMLVRYIKVRRLAEQGADGEKQAAQRVLTKLEKEYSNIRLEAKTWERLTEGEVEDPEPPVEEPPHWSDVYHRQQSEQRQAQWRDKFSEWGQSASQAFSWVAGMATNAFSAHEARTLAEENGYTRIQVRHNESGSITLNVRLTPELHNYLTALSEEQKAVYANTVGQRVAADLYGLLH